MQAIDFATTLATWRGFDSFAPLLVVKILASVAGYFCWRVGQYRFLAGINTLFVFVVTWNVLTLLGG